MMSQKQSVRTTPQNVRFRCYWKTVIYDVIKARQWTETDSELDWDFFWSDVSWLHEYFDHIHLAEHQRINHFRNYYELTRKDLLIKNLKRMKKALVKENRSLEAAKYDFFPATYTLPAEYGMFVEQFKRNAGVWIMKPVGKAQGKGIFLFTKLSQISEWKKDHRWKADNHQVLFYRPFYNHINFLCDEMVENYIVQKYIHNPYLVGGKKFDLRIYVLVLAYTPLKAYLYRSGFARFTNSRFSMKKEDILNNYVHLTNFAIQKTAPTYDSKNGTKWPLHSLKLHMISKHGEKAIDALFHEIQLTIIRSLLAVQNVIIQDKHCFELYGYDILIDEDLKPWLLEVNASPSLAADTPSDYELKFGMLEDLLFTIDMERRLPLHSSPKQIGGYDLLIDQGSCPTFDDVPMILGCRNDRVHQLKKIFGSHARTTLNCQK